MSTIEERLEEKIDEAIKAQAINTANFMEPNLSRLIRILEYIRGRRFVKCMICKADLTQTACPHHEDKLDGTLPADHDHSVDRTLT